MAQRDAAAARPSRLVHEGREQTVLARVGNRRDAEDLSSPSHDKDA